MAHSASQRREADAATESSRSHAEGHPRRLRLHLLETAPVSLTPREIQCLHWCAEGKSYWESGVILGISERTVSFHMESVRSKLAAANNAHAVARAFKTGFLAP